MVFLFTMLQQYDIINIVRRYRAMTQEKRIAFRCSTEEFEQIKDQADNAGLNVTDYLKFLVINDSAPIDERG